MEETVEETNIDQTAIKQADVEQAEQAEGPVTVVTNYTRAENMMFLRRISPQIKADPVECLEGSISSVEIDGTTFNLVALDGEAVLLEATTGEAA